MADFAPNYTARYKVRYSSLGKSHSMTWRVSSSVTDPTGIAAKVGLFLADMEGVLFDDWTVIGADFALADSDIFLPATPPDQPTGAVGVTGAHATDATFQIGFVGRSALGGKARMFLYGTNYAQNVASGETDDWRYTSAESPAVSDAIVRLNETSPALVANDDSIAVWYEYVNLKYNDRWLRRLRRG